MIGKKADVQIFTDKLMLNIYSVVNKKEKTKLPVSKEWYDLFIILIILIVYLMGLPYGNPN